MEHLKTKYSPRENVALLHLRRFISTFVNKAVNLD